METQTISTTTTQVRVNTLMYKVYGWMFAGLAISAITAYYTATNAMLTKFVYGNPFVIFILIFVELFLVIGLVAAIQKMSSGTALLMFLVYSALNGLTLSSIFFVYDIGAIALAFVCASAMFGAMSIYGYFTKRDLTSWGPLLFMSLIGILVAMLINIFLRNSAVDYAISIVGVLVFTGLAAYDNQKIKQMLSSSNADEQTLDKMAIISALNLYLDFINLFLMLLRIFSRSR